MANTFISPIGDLERIFVDDYALIDQYAKTGSLWSWGAGSSGQLGNNGTTTRSSPVQTVSGGTSWNQISCGDFVTAAIKSDGTLWLWGGSGFSYAGALGDNTTVRKSSPVQTIAGGTNWKQVSAGANRTAAIKTDGTLWVWGFGNNGELGDNTNSNNKSSPVQTIAAGKNWKQVSTGGYHQAAIKTDGTLWVWGFNMYGELGDNTTSSKSSPIQTASGGTNWKQVSAGSFGVTAIKTDGTLWSWGRNDNGQLGHNDVVSKSTPVQVGTDTTWKQVQTSNLPFNTYQVAHTVAIKTDGTLWAWGDNTRGQLGDNTVVPKSSPVQTVAGGTNWKQVSCNSFGHTAAIKTDGTLWSWGYGANGALGDNTIVNKSSPVQTVAGGNNWKQVSCGYIYTCAIYFYDTNNLYPV